MMNERYENLDGLRSISCLCIIAMHIRANAEYNLGTVGSEIVASWTHFVPLFLMISGFGMFCGYYLQFKNGCIDLNRFYNKRYKKLLPFFAVLILIDIVMDRSIAHLIEGLAEISLVFGLLPNNQPNVIGVSWTLGVIFLFYMLFPFIVYLCWDKKRALMTFISSIVLSLICSFYYFTSIFVVEGFAARHNFLYCSPWIIGGGIVYHYRAAIKKFVGRYRWRSLFLCCLLTVVWYFIPNDDSGLSMIENLILFMPWLMYAISVDSRILNNRIMKYLSGISLEMYLAQMVVFRVIERAHCLYLLGNGWPSFLLVWISVVVGLMAFIEIWKCLLSLAQRKIAWE